MTTDDPQAAQAAAQAMTHALLDADLDWRRLYHESPTFKTGVRHIVDVAMLAAEAHAAQARELDAKHDLARRAAEQRGVDHDRMRRAFGDEDP